MKDVVVTLDVDWAPDFAIDFAAERLVASGVRSTWFITHSSPAIERLRQRPELFELGIHPNFLTGSTHGATPESILSYCMAMVPEAVSIRTHALVQSSPLLDLIITHTPIETDVSLLLPHAPCLSPVEYRRSGRTLLRLPYYWEDDDEMERAFPCWRLKPLSPIDEGLKIFDFHPIHVYLNSSNMGPYHQLKEGASRLSEATSGEADAFVYTGEGTQTLFMEVLELSAATGQSLFIRDVHMRWQRGLEQRII